KRSKEWWAQAEAFNAFLLMSELFPDDPHRYYEKFCAQWNYCMNYLIDHEHGGWYWGGIDIVPENIHSPKGSIWKCNYHTSRSLINCINRLKTRRAGNTTMPQIPREKQKR
ncbi:MAG TPA: AGE family epimerase/isomerase, partial [Bacteroidota bacterium]|nr:AGE family epimerase/isomerase [Bacteroidota bacterium]